MLTPLRRLARVAALAGLVVGVAGCAGPRSLNFGDGPRVDGLRPIEPVPFRYAWARPGVSFEGYDRLMPRFAGMSYRKPPREVYTLVQPTYNHPMPKELEKRLMVGLADAFRESIDRSEGWQLADARGPRVLHAKVSVVDLVLGVSLTHPGDSEDWVDGVGAFTLVVELHDSETGTLLARAAERRAIATERDQPIKATVGDTTFESLRIFRDWARKLDTLLNELRGAALAGDDRPPGDRLTRLASDP